MTMESTVVIGTPNWPTMAADEGLAVCRPMNSRAKLPPPISSDTQISRQSGRGGLRSQGKVTATTMAKRVAA
jgi:hypothetical protein